MKLVCSNRTKMEGASIPQPILLLVVEAVVVAVVEALDVAHLILAVALETAKSIVKILRIRMTGPGVNFVNAKAILFIIAGIASTKSLFLLVLVMVVLNNRAPKSLLPLLLRRMELIQIGILIRAPLIRMS